MSQTYNPYIGQIPSGDAQKGEEIARNLCNTMGITPEEATKQAANFFNIPH